MKRALLVLATLVFTMPPAQAGPLEDGIAALDGGQYQAARNAFLRAAEAGNAEAQIQLAMILIDGSAGVKDLVSAAAWLQRAAENKHSDAQYRLGLLLYQGIQGKPDIAKAAYWFEQAAGQAHPEAAYNLGVLYDDGQGVPHDIKRAMALYRQAANGGVLEAEHTIGSMLAFGRKIVADPIEGGMWLELALRGGDKDVKEELDSLRRGLTAAQLTEIKTRVQNHLAKSPHH